jgi:deferrochelatase/peroxidase EfeB
VIAAPTEEDKADVQRLVAYGYDLDLSRHFVLEVSDAGAARTFLSGLAAGGLLAHGGLRHGDAKKLWQRGICPASVGFSFRGLAKLGLALPYLRVFEEKARAFSEGAFRRAGRYLLDTGSSAAENWEPCFGPERAHVLLSLHANETAALDDATRRLEKLPGAGGLTGWHGGTRLDGCHLPRRDGGRTVHFGFRDGIAMPGICGFHDAKRGRSLHQPGEFLLGYWNDAKFNPWLLVNPWSRSDPWLLPANPAPRLRDFFRNGSFAAFRMIEQHEKELLDFLDKWAGKYAVPAEYLKAKLAGRWDDGSVVRASAGKAAVPEDELNVFDFSDDPDGVGCPFGAHIRRMNPRADQVAPKRRRPLIRRGMPYGPAYREAPGERRGLLGLFFCASLEDQFEFLLREWGNASPMGPRGRAMAKDLPARDPFSANRQRPKATFDIPLAGERASKLDSLQPFLRTRGTLYAFYPSLTALGRIARCGAP